MTTSDINDKIFHNINNYLLTNFFPGNTDTTDLLSTPSYNTIRNNTINTLQNLIDSLHNNRLPITPDYLSKLPNDMLLYVYEFLTEKDICRIAGSNKIFSDYCIKLLTKPIEYFCNWRHVWVLSTGNWNHGIIIPCINDPNPMNLVMIDIYQCKKFHVHVNNTVIIIPVQLANKMMKVWHHKSLPTAISIKYYDDYHIIQERNFNNIHTIWEWEDSQLYVGTIDSSGFSSYFSPCILTS
jgi:hypothetical protein